MIATARGYLGVLLALTVGGVSCLVAAGLGWQREAAGGLGAVTVELTGSDVAPLVQAGGLMALASVVAVHATRRVGRQVVGAVAAVTGIAVTAAALSAQAGTPEEVTTATGPAALAVAGGLMVAAAGAAVVVWGRTWPTMGRRFERTGRRGPERPGQPGPSDRSAWDALDRGEDPTV